jgi:hypothetical protein
MRPGGRGSSSPHLQRKIDLLTVNGEDLREWPLIEPKRRLAS